MATIWDTPNQGVGGWATSIGNQLTNGGKAGGAFAGSRLTNAQNTPTLTNATEMEFERLNPQIARYKQGEPELYKKRFDEWKATRTDVNNQVNSAVNFTALGAQKGGQLAAGVANQNAVLAEQKAQAQKAKELAGTAYTDSLAAIMAGRNNIANATDAQQGVIAQSALGGWSGAAGALAGQQKASQLGVTEVLQDRTARAQDIFATNSAIAQQTQLALQNEFALNQADYDRQVGYSRQMLESANQALQYATGEQKLLLQAQMDKYSTALQQYQNSIGTDALSDEKKWTTLKGVLGGAIALGSAIAAIPTAGATLPGVGVGVGIAAG